MKKIVFQGEPGANSHIACANAVYPDYEAVPAPTFEDCFQAMTRGDVDLAMIPIENSLAGRVADIHHLLPDSGLHIIGEYFLPIRFQLMAPHGATLETIKTVESHVHALGQCRRILREHGCRAVVAGDTAGAARIIAEAGDITRAALAPRFAAELYGLDILAENVEDAEHNTTRFVILSREAVNRALRQRSGHHDLRLPGAQHSGGALQGARRLCDQRHQHDEARELSARRRASSATQFYADVEGHPDDAQPGAGAGGTGVLLGRGAHSRRLSGRVVPRRGSCLSRGDQQACELTRLDIGSRLAVRSERERRIADMATSSCPVLQREIDHAVDAIGPDDAIFADQLDRVRARRAESRRRSGARAPGGADRIGEHAPELQALKRLGLTSCRRE